MDNFPDFIDLEHMFFFMGDENYTDEIENIVKDTEACEALSKQMQKIDLFRWCMKFGYSRIWIYMYVQYGLFYTKAELDAVDSLSTGKLNNPQEPAANAAVAETSGVSEGIRLQGWDRDSIKKQRLNKCLYQMRKYSTYGSSPYGGYGWAFNRKHMQVFDFQEFAEKYIPIRA